MELPDPSELDVSSVLHKRDQDRSVETEFPSDGIARLGLVNARRGE
jgi:hypothetical protein